MEACESCKTHGRFVFQAQHRVGWRGLSEVLTGRNKCAKTTNMCQLNRCIVAFINIADVSSSHRNIYNPPTIYCLRAISVGGSRWRSISKRANGNSHCVHLWMKIDPCGFPEQIENDAMVNNFLTYAHAIFSPFNRQAKKVPISSAVRCKMVFTRI